MNKVRVYKTQTLVATIEVDDKLAQNLSGDCDADQWDEAVEEGIKLAEALNEWEMEEEDYEFKVLEDQSSRALFMWLQRK